MANELPPPPILTPPAGLLGFLGLKSGGKQPGQLAGYLQPTLDHVDFYRAGARVLLFASGASAATQNNPSGGWQVPVGKVWLVESIVASSGVLGVAANVTAYIRLYDQSGLNIFDVGVPTNLGATGNTLLARLSKPTIMLPGWKGDVYTTAPAAVTAFNWFVFVWGYEVAA